MCPPPAQARLRLEYLRKRRQNWELIYESITMSDAEATLSDIEAANARVEAALSERSRDKMPLGKLKVQLEELQQVLA